MWRIASLRKSFERSPSKLCFDVCVTDSSCENREESARTMNGHKNTGDYRIVGLVNFRDERKADEIVRDFTLRYPGNFETGKDIASRGVYASYAPEYNEFLTQAFVIYFSKLSN